jgi:hypothetical protein
MARYYDLRAKSMEQARIEDEAVLSEMATWVPGTKAAIFGSVFVSHPSCLGVVEAVGAFGADERVVVSRITSKGKASTASGLPYAEAIDVGLPFQNKVADGHFIRARFMPVDGYPSGIYEWWRDHPQSLQNANGYLFAWQGVFYYLTRLENHDWQRIIGEFHGTDVIPDDVGGKVEAVGGHDLVVLEDRQADQFLVMGATPQTERGVRLDVPITTDGGIPAGNEGPVSCTPGMNQKLYWGLGTSGLPHPGRTSEILTCMAVSTNEAEAKAAVATALTNGWLAAFEAAQSYWAAAMAGLRERWLRLPAEVRVKGYMAVQQLIMHTYLPDAQGAFLGAGAGQWYQNFIRDTSWVVRALAKPRPGMAADLLDWFANVAATVEGHNAFGLDGLEVANTNNTDNAATFLLAVGEYYRLTNDWERMVALQPQLNAALLYAQTNYSAVDGHILALHPHDFADDGHPTLPVALIKYESMVDVLWIAGLEAAKPIFARLGDAPRASFCTTTANGLRAHLADYYAPGTTRLVHSLKPDASQQDAGWYLPSYLYDAWLLGNADSYAWLTKSKPVLGIKGCPLRYSTAINGTPGEQPVSEGWAPFLGIIALLAAQHGDYEPLRFVLDAWPGGTWPEFWYMKRDVTLGKPAHWSHARNFPWAYASIIELVEGLKLLAD